MSSSCGDSPGALQRDYEGDLATLRAARRDVVEWLTHRGADQETKDRAALIVSELTSNAIQTAPGSTYNLQVALVDQQCAAISVRNRPTNGLPPAQALACARRTAAQAVGGARTRAGDCRLVVGAGHCRARR